MILETPCLQASTASPVSVMAPVPPARLSSRTAFYLKASMTLAFLAGSSAPTPLYGLYQQQWGFSTTMLTVVFGVYAIAVLVALLLVGRLSDHIGRRPVLIVAAILQAVAMVFFATATGLGDLLVARVIQGVSAGAAVAAVGAGLLDIDRARGAVANSVAPMVGTATGGLLAGLMVQYLPEPTHLVYGFLGLVFIAQAVGIAFIAETSGLRPGAWASMRPTLAIPKSVRGPMLLAVPALVAVWALGGFYASLGPGLLRSWFGSDSFVAGGAGLFVVAGFGAVSVLVLHARSSQILVRIGATSLLVGVGLVLAAIHAVSLPLFFIGSSIAGVGFGAGFQGALRTVIATIEPHERAGVLAVVFIVSYLSMGAPAIFAGYWLAHHGHVATVASEFGMGVMALAALTLLGTSRRATRA